MLILFYLFPQIRYLESAVLETDSKTCKALTEDISWLVDQMQEEQAEKMTHDEAILYIT